MAQTKRRRRSKHRGTAAGTIESRGRTGRKPEASERGASKQEQSRQRRLERLDRPPTWKSAGQRALIAAAVFLVAVLVLFQVGLAGEKQTIATSLALAAAAFLIYVPLGYKVDRMLWERRMRKAGRPIPARGKR